MNFKEKFERILLEFSTGKYRKQIEKARTEFFGLSGVIHEDSPIYAERIKLFLDWYVFDRELDDEDLTPAQFFYDIHVKEFSAEEASFHKGILNFISTLFIVKSNAHSYVKVMDMFTGSVYKAHDMNIIDLVNKGDVFQGRLLKVDNKMIFSNGFCFHDQDARSYIEAEIKKIKNMPKQYHQSFMMRLAFMKVKSTEYDHVPIKDIYRENPKVVF